MKEKKYKGPMFKKVDDLTYWTFLKTAQRKWLKEALPGVTIEKVFWEQARHMPSYKHGRWNGYVDQIKFSKTSEVLLFRVAWI